MRIVLATPLYPPDIAEPAPYVKEFAKRLSKDNEVTIVAYGEYPELIPGVAIIAVDKSRQTFLRLFSYARALLHAARESDYLYAENGASVELPLIVVSLLSGKPYFFHVGDRAAHEHARHSLVRHAIERIAAAHARKVIHDAPLPRPEILPLEEFPTEAMAAYDAAWQAHVAMLASLMSHA